MHSMRPDPELVEVSRHLRQDQAEERALVLLAMGIPYWIIPIDSFFSIFVEIHDASEAVDQLTKFETEQHESALLEPMAEQQPSRRPASLSLFVFSWIMIGCFLAQSRGSIDWLKTGSADSRLILQGQWWRTLTALTLHADPGHLMGNLAAGILFTWALLPWFGTGWTWLGTVVSGALGNWINAWGYRGTVHDSIGASTAVFGALGMLVGHQLAAKLAAHRAPRLRDIWFPIAGGLSLLAYLGSQGANVDYMAHAFGLLCGAAVGLLLTLARVEQRTPDWLQKLLATLAMLLPFFAWHVAITHR